jgi:carboxymethylenebutenolidase
MRLACTESEVPTGDGTMRTFNARPAHGVAPAVILYMDAVGYREELKDFARRLAQAGYSSWLPDLFYRDGGPSFDPHFPRTDYEKFAPLMRKLTRNAVLSDTRALVDWIDASEIPPGRIGTIGFCMGGRMALWAAAEFPERVAAVASLHGGQLGTASPDSPHRFADRLACELYLGFAGDDDLVPQEHIDTLRAALDAAGLRYESETHPGTQHGYTFPARHCYDHGAAERSWERVLSLFARKLKD